MVKAALQNRITPRGILRWPTLAIIRQSEMSLKVLGDNLRLVPLAERGRGLAVALWGGHFDFHNFEYCGFGKWLPRRHWQSPFVVALISGSRGCGSAFVWALGKWASGVQLLGRQMVLKECECPFLRC